MPERIYCEKKPYLLKFKLARCYHKSLGWIGRLQRGEKCCIGRWDHTSAAVKGGEQKGNAADRCSKHILIWIKLYNGTVSVWKKEPWLCLGSPATLLATQLAVVLVWVSYLFITQEVSECEISLKNWSKKWCRWLILENKHILSEIQSRCQFFVLLDMPRFF